MWVLLLSFVVLIRGRSSSCRRSGIGGSSSSSRTFITLVAAVAGAVMVEVVPTSC